MTDVAAVIAADKATIANPRLSTAAAVDAWFDFAVNRLPVYIAAIEAMTALHTVERRYQSHEDAEWSMDTPEEAADVGDCAIEDVVFFEICSHCGDLEMCVDVDEGHYMDALWPCPTIRALAVLAPSTDKEQQ